MKPQMVGAGFLWLQMASFGSSNQLDYDRKKQIVEAGDLNPQMAHLSINDFIAQLV